ESCVSAHVSWAFFPDRWMVLGMSAPLSVRPFAVRFAMSGAYPLRSRHTGSAVGEDRDPTPTRRSAMTERSRVLVIGGGFAGFHAARSLAKRVGDAAEIVLISATDY